MAKFASLINNFENMPQNLDKPIYLNELEQFVENNYFNYTQSWWVSRVFFYAFKKNNNIMRIIYENNNNINKMIRPSQTVFDPSHRLLLNNINTKWKTIFFRAFLYIIINIFVASIIKK